MDGTGDPARAAALELFEGRWRLVNLKARLRGRSRDLGDADLNDLAQDALLVYWQECLRVADRGGGGTDIAVRFSVARGWRQFCKFKWPKSDAMGHAWLESDLEARRRSKLGDEVGSPSDNDEERAHNSPLDEIGHIPSRLNMNAWRDRLGEMDDSERWWLTFLFRSGINVTRAAARLGVRRQSLQARLRRDPGYGRRLGGRIFHWRTGRDRWLFPPNIESFLEKRAACPPESGDLKNRGDLFSDAASFFPVQNSLPNKNGDSHGLRTTANAAAGGA